MGWGGIVLVRLERSSHAFAAAAAAGGGGGLISHVCPSTLFLPRFSFHSVCKRMTKRNGRCGAATALSCFLIPGLCKP